MGSILNLYNRIKKVDVNTVVSDTIEEASPLITDRQKGQMLEGVNAKGARIGRYRNPAYAQMKAAMNPVANGSVDLLLTGDFYRGIYTEARGDTIVIDSTDEKTDSLAKKYGEIIFGLNKNTKAELIREDLKPIFLKNIKAATGL